MNNFKSCEYESVKRNLEQLLVIADFSEYRKCFIKLCNDRAVAENFAAFITTEAFAKDLQKRIQTAVGVREAVLCLEYLILTNPNVAEGILGYRGFALSVLPVKLNEEKDIEAIGLCLELVAKCDSLLGELVTKSDDFDRDIVIDLLNKENDVYKVGHTIERIWRGNQAFAKALVESPYFDIAQLVEKLNTEDDMEKLEMCIGGIEFASPAVAQKIKAGLLKEIV